MRKKKSFGDKWIDQDKLIVTNGSSKVTNRLPITESYADYLSVKFFVTNTKIVG